MSGGALAILGTVAARRRSLADAVADELRHGRPLPYDQYLMAWREEEANDGITDPDPPPARLVDRCVLVDVDHPGSIREALATLAELAHGDPPNHAIRSEGGSYEAELPARVAPCPGLERLLSPTPSRRAERLLRATTDSVSLVARTDGPVILLLDETPGQLLALPIDHPAVAGLVDMLAATTTPAT